MSHIAKKCRKVRAIQVAKLRLTRDSGQERGETRSCSWKNHLSEDWHEDTIGEIESAVSGRMVRAAKVRNMPNKLESSDTTWEVKSSSLLEIRTRGLPWRENMNINRKVATFLAVADAVKGASTHFVKWSTATRIYRWPSMIVGRGSMILILTTWKGKSGERIVCLKLLLGLYGFGTRK